MSNLARKSTLPAWKLEDAKARFSEVVRLARDEGPQRVTVRGRDAVVVLSASDYDTLVPKGPHLTLASLFASFPDTGHIDLQLDEPWPSTIFRDPPDFRE